MVTHSADATPTVSCVRPRSTRSLFPATSIEASIDQHPQYDCRVVPPRFLDASVMCSLRSGLIEPVDTYAVDHSSNTTTSHKEKIKKS